MKMDKKIDLWHPGMIHQFGCLSNKHQICWLPTLQCCLFNHRGEDSDDGNATVDGNGDGESDVVNASSGHIARPIGPRRGCLLYSTDLLFLRVLALTSSPQDMMAPYVIWPVCGR